MSDRGFPNEWRMQVFTRPVPLFSTSTLNTFDLALSYAESTDFSGSSDLWVIRLNYDQRAAPFIYVPLPSYMSQGRQPCPDANVCTAYLLKWIGRTCV